MGSQLFIKQKDGLIWGNYFSSLTAFEKNKQVISGGPINRWYYRQRSITVLCYSHIENSKKLKQGLSLDSSNAVWISLTRMQAKLENVTPKKLPTGGRVESIEPHIWPQPSIYCKWHRHLLALQSPIFYKTGKSMEKLELISTGFLIEFSDFTSLGLEGRPKNEKACLCRPLECLFSFDDRYHLEKISAKLTVTPIHTDIVIHRGDLIWVPWVDWNLEILPL